MLCIINTKGYHCKLIKIISCIFSLITYPNKNHILPLFSFLIHPKNKCSYSFPFFSLLNYDIFYFPSHVHTEPKTLAFPSPSTFCRLHLHSTCLHRCRRAGKKAGLTQALDGLVQNVRGTFQILEKPAAPSPTKVEWSDVIKFGDKISKQATIAGMLWSGGTPDVKEIKDNLNSYSNVLYGFILLCHESTAGAGPTLHSNIRASAKQVIDQSILLLTGAVSSYESCDSGKRSLIPQLSGSVWEACAALKKTPPTNCIAIGRAITQVAVSIKDVLREMKELKPAEGGASDVSEDGEHGSNEDDFSDGDLSEDLSAEEMHIAQLIIGVVSDTQLVFKELIRFVSGLLKNSDHEHKMTGYIDSLERLLSCCQEVGVQVNELGACVYPPQEIPQMRSIVKKIDLVADEMQMQVGSIEGLPESLVEAFEGLKNSLAKLESGLSSDLIPQMSRLAI